MFVFQNLKLGDLPVGSPAFLSVIAKLAGRLVLLYFFDLCKFFSSKTIASADVLEAASERIHVDELIRRDVGTDELDAGERWTAHLDSWRLAAGNVIVDGS